MNLAEALRVRLFPIDPPPQFVCPRCWYASWHPDDRENGWCGNCRLQTGVPTRTGRDELLAAAVAEHDKVCSCDPRYVTSCTKLPQIILDLGTHGGTDGKGGADASP